MNGELKNKKVQTKTKKESFRYSFFPTCMFMFLRALLKNI